MNIDELEPDVAIFVLHYGAFLAGAGIIWAIPTIIQFLGATSPETLNSFAAGLFFAACYVIYMLPPVHRRPPMQTM